jgi:hypothetical protein
VSDKHYRYRTIERNGKFIPQFKVIYPWWYGVHPFLLAFLILPNKWEDYYDIPNTTASEFLCGHRLLLSFRTQKEAETFLHGRDGEGIAHQ